MQSPSTSLGEPAPKTTANVSYESPRADSVTTREPCVYSMDVFTAVLADTYIWYID